jgi:hypothetical protein
MWGLCLEGGALVLLGLELAGMSRGVGGGWVSK